MGKNKRCTPEMRKLIVKKYCQEGLPMREIAVQLMCSKKKVYGAIETYADTGSIENRIRKRRGKKTTARDDQIICRLRG